MAGKCELCYAWRPVEWDGTSKYIDEVAYCAFQEKSMPKDWTCPEWAIVKRGAKPKVTMAPVKVEAPTVTYTGELFGHQIECFERFKDESEIALFLEPGTGKSAIALRIASYKFKKGLINALLIVAPNDIHSQFHREQIPLWLDCSYNSQCLFGRGGQKEAYPFDPDPDSLMVVSVNIDTFSTPKKWVDIVEWANMNRTMIILDEATSIKTYTAQRTQRMLYAFNDTIYNKKRVVRSTVKTVARAILTGTPVTNGSADLFSLMEFLRPNFFGRNIYAFENRYGMFTTINVNDRNIKVALSEEMWKAIKGMLSFNEANYVTGCSEDTFNTVHSQSEYVGPYKHADELRELIKPVSYFKRLKDCYDMPEQVYNLRELTMTPEIEQCYDDMVDSLIAQYEGHVTSAKNKITALIRLQQICSGFIVERQDELPEDDTDTVDRMYGLIDEIDYTPNEVTWLGTTQPKLQALYRDVEEMAKPLIILTRFTAEAARIYDELSTKYSTCLMTGWKRVGTLEEFKAGKYQVMVANSSVVGRGLNLQNSHVILFYANTFSLETRIQSEGRIYRIGQGHPCLYVDYSYFSDNYTTIDQKITSTLRMKRSLLDYIQGVDIKELVH
jgi:hypothetical protein